MAQIVFGLYLLGMFTRLAVLSWQNPGGPGAPKSALYGIWDVERLSVDGEFRPPMFNDYDRRWRRVIFDTPDLMIFQRLDDSFAHYGSTIDVDRHQIALRKIQSRQWKSTFSFDRRGDDEMILEGEMDGHAIHAELQRVGMDGRLPGPASTDLFSAWVRANVDCQRRSIFHLLSFRRSAPSPAEEASPPAGRQAPLDFSSPFDQRISHVLSASTSRIPHVLNITTLH